MHPDENLTQLLGKWTEGDKAALDELMPLVYKQLRSLAKRYQVSEVISVVVSPTPLEGLEIGATAQKLSVQQVATWERSWGGTVGRLEMKNGAGKTWTRQEKEAGANATRSLTQDEPAPQTLYYKPEAKSGQPVMVNVSLRYGRTIPTARTRRRS